MHPATQIDAGAHLDALLPVAAPRTWARVAGVALPARSVHALLRGGARRVVVVCPSGAAPAVRSALGETSRHRSVVVVERPDEHADPTTALTAASDRVAPPVLVAMPDHLFSPNIVRGLLRGPCDRTLVAVDSNIARCADIAGALKVRHDGSRVTDVGSDLPAYDGLAVGLLLACHDLFSESWAAREVVGWGSLVNALQLLVTSGGLLTFDCGGHRWSPASSVAARAHAERLLLLHGDDLLDQRPSSIPPLVQRDRFQPSLFERAARRQRSGRLRPLYDAD